MAKDTSREKLSDSVKDKELDVSSFDNPADDQLESFDFDFGADTDTEKNRSAIGKVRAGAAAALEKMSETFIPNIEDRLNEHIPEASSFYSEITRVSSDVVGLATEFQRDLGPTIQQLKRAGRTLAPRIKALLPNRLGKLYDRMVADTSDRGAVADKIDKSKMEDQTIQASIESIFNKNLAIQETIQREQYQDQKSDMLIDRALTSQRHMASMSQMSRVESSLAFQKQFIEKIQIPMMKKDLELKYRHFFVARDTLMEVRGMSKIIEQQLNQIRHNTALPDIQKQRKLETLKMVSHTRLANLFTNWSSDVVKRIKNRIFTPVKDGLSAIADTADVVADTFGGDIGEPLTAHGIVGGAAGSMLAGKAADKAATLLFGEKYGKRGMFTNQLARLNNFFSNGMIKLQLLISGLADRYEGTLLGEGLDILRPKLERTAGTTANVMMQDPSAPATLNNQALISITTIMPGYLAKINKHLETLVTGKPAEELVFDNESNDFIRASTVLKRFESEAYATAEARNRYFGEVVGKVRGAYAYSVGKSLNELNEFDDLEEELVKFLNNSMRKFYPINPPIIAAYAELVQDSIANEDEEFDPTSSVRSNPTSARYIESVLKDIPIEKAKPLLLLLSAICYNDDGSINKDNVNYLNNTIIRGGLSQNYLDVIDRYSKEGKIRYLKKYVTSGGSRFALSDQVISDMYLKDVSVSDETYKSSRDAVALSAYDKVEMLNTKLGKDLRAFSNEYATEEGYIAEAINWVTEKIDDNEEKIDKAIATVKSWRGNFKENVLSYLRKKGHDDAASWFNKHFERYETIRGKVTDTVLGTDNAIAKHLSETRKREERESGSNIARQDISSLDAFANNTLTDDDVYKDGINPAIGGGNVNIKGGVNIKFPSKFNIGNYNELIKGLNLTKSVTAPIESKLDSVISSLDGMGGKFSASLQNQQVSVDVGSSISGSYAPVVSAITQFENTFKQFADTQVSIPEILAKQLEATGALTGQLDAIARNTRSTIVMLGRGAWWTVKKTGSGAWRLVNKISPVKLLEGAAKGTLSVLKTVGAGMGILGRGAKAGFDTVKGWHPFDKLKAGAGYVGDKLIDIPVAAVAMAGIAKDALRGIFGGVVDDVFGYGQRVVEGALGIKTNIKDRIAGFKQGVKDRINQRRFVDIYLKDEINPGKPLLSAKKQEEGVYFVKSGHKVLTSFAITSPVMELAEDGKSPKVLITEDDIKKGLVDINNKPIASSRSLIGKFVKGSLRMVGHALGITGDIFEMIKKGVNPLTALATGSINLTFKAMSGALSGIFKVGRRIFGIKEALTKDQLHDVVGTRLDIIIAILKKRFGYDDGDIKPDDTTKAPENASKETKPEDEKKTEGEAKPEDKKDEKKEEKKEDKEKPKSEAELQAEETAKKLQEKKKGKAESAEEKKPGIFRRIVNRLKNIGIEKQEPIDSSNNEPLGTGIPAPMPRTMMDMFGPDFVLSAGGEATKKEKAEAKKRDKNAKRRIKAEEAEIKREELEKAKEKARIDAYRATPYKPSTVSDVFGGDWLLTAGGEATSEEKAVAKARAKSAKQRRKDEIKAAEYQARMFNNILLNHPFLIDDNSDNTAKRAFIEKLKAGGDFSKIGIELTGVAASNHDDIDYDAGGPSFFQRLRTGYADWRDAAKAEESHYAPGWFKWAKNAGKFTKKFKGFSFFGKRRDSGEPNINTPLGTEIGPQGFLGAWKPVSYAILDNDGVMQMSIVPIDEAGNLIGTPPTPSGSGQAGIGYDSTSSTTATDDVRQPTVGGISGSQRLARPMGTGEDIIDAEIVDDKKAIAEGSTADSNGDGKRDTIFDIRRRRIQEANEKKRNSFYETMKQLKDNLSNDKQEERRGFFKIVAASVLGIMAGIKKLVSGVFSMPLTFAKYLMYLAKGGNLLSTIGGLAGGLGGRFGGRLRRRTRGLPTLGTLRGGAGKLLGSTGIKLAGTALAADALWNQGDSYLYKAADSIFDFGHGSSKELLGMDNVLPTGNDITKGFNLNEVTFDSVRNGLWNEDARQAYAAQNSPDAPLLQAVDMNNPIHASEAGAKRTANLVSDYDGKIAVDNSGRIDMAEESAGKPMGWGSRLWDYATTAGEGALYNAGLSMLGLNVGGKLAALAMSNPWTMAAAAAIGVAWVIDDFFFDGKGKSNLFNYLGVNTDSFVEARCALYGTPTSGWGGTWLGGSILRQTIKLEEEVYEVLSGKRGKFTDDEMREWAERFKFDPDDENQVKYFRTWFKYRFLVVFKHYLSALRDLNAGFEDAYNLPDEKKRNILAMVQSRAGNVANINNPLRCTVEAYNAVKKEFTGEAGENHSNVKVNPDGSLAASMVGQLRERTKIENGQVKMATGEMKTYLADRAKTEKDRLALVALEDSIEGYVDLPYTHKTLPEIDIDKAGDDKEKAELIAIDAKLKEFIQERDNLLKLKTDKPAQFTSQHIRRLNDVNYYIDHYKKEKEQILSRRPDLAKIADQNNDPFSKEDLELFNRLPDTTKMAKKDTAKYMTSRLMGSSKITRNDPFFGQKTGIRPADYGIPMATGGIYGAGGMTSTFGSVMNSGPMMGTGGGLKGIPDIGSIPPSAKPPKGDPNIIGSYIGNFESGGKGSAAIGYDDNGGYSYGTFQLASRAGSLKEFVKWCATKAPIVYGELFPVLGSANTGPKSEFVQKWLALVKAGHINFNLEHEFFIEKHYKVALNELRKRNPEAAAAVDKSRALQEVLYSASVQHGPYWGDYGQGAPGIFSKTFKPGISTPDYIRAIYADRSTRFTDPKVIRGVHNRFRKEMADMLALDRQMSGTGLTENEAATNPSDISYKGNGQPVPEMSSSANLGDVDTSKGFGSALGGGGNASSMGGAMPMSTGESNTASPSAMGIPTAAGAGGSSVSGGATPALSSDGTIDKSVLSVQSGVDVDNLPNVMKSSLSTLGRLYQEKNGEKIIVTSGKRSMEQQAKLRAQKGNNAARPSPTAPHICGLGVDISPSQAAKAERQGLLDQANLWRPLKNGLGKTDPEAWHIEVKGSREPGSMRITSATIAALGGADPNAGTANNPLSAQEQAEGNADGTKPDINVSAPQAPSPAAASSSMTTMPSSTEGVSVPSAPAPAVQTASTGAVTSTAQPEVSAPPAPEFPAPIDYTNMFSAIIQRLGELLGVQNDLAKAITSVMKQTNPAVDSIFTKDRTVKSGVA